MTNIIIYIFKSSLSHSHSNFQASRLRKLNNLLEKEIFEIMNKQDIPAEARVFNSRFVNQIKNKGTEKVFEKSRLIIQAFNNLGKYKILTQALTIQRVSQRLIIALTLTISKLSLYTRDITQIYTQSRFELTRDIFILVSIEIRLSIRTVLRVILPLYKIAESNTY